MKKRLIVAVILVLILAAVIRFRFALAYMFIGGETVHLQRSEISSVTGTSVTSVPLMQADLTESQIDVFVEKFNSLGLKRIPVRYTKKGGWLYSFSAFRNDGTFVSIAFLEGGLVTVDGYTCVTFKPVSGIMGEFFQN